MSHGDDDALAYDLRPPSWRRALPRIGLDEGSPLPPRKLAELLSFAGERTAAVDAYQEHLAESPDDLEALERLAGVFDRLGRDADRAAIHRQIAAIVSDRLGVAAEHREAVIAYEMAAHGLGEPPPIAPPAYVAASFDAFAETFDDLLRGALRYQGPEQLIARVARAFGAGDATLTIGDVGCGTGVMGDLLRPYARHLHGVDLSPRMLKKALDRRVYDELVVGELTAYLVERPARFDVIVAADVFGYLGDLAPAFTAIAHALRPGGGFFCTVERADGDSYVLCDTARYAHAEPYLRATADAAGLLTASIDEEPLRRQQGFPVRALVGAFRKPG